MSDKPSAAWYLAPIFLGIILVMSASLAINHTSFGYGGGGGGWGNTMDPRVCGDKLCSEIPGGREAWEERNDPPQEKSIAYFSPPLQQIRDGVEPSHVTCNEGLELLVKQSNGIPACVKPTSVAKLVERGWAFETSSIDSFEECAAAGNPVMESYPRQCRTPDGKHFVEIIPGKEECEIAGGLWGIWGNDSSASASCNPSTFDVGKECTDSSQCQSFCQANEGSEINSEEAGVCYGYELAICMQEVRNGVVEFEWCQ